MFPLPCSPHLVRSDTDDMMCLCCLARRHLVRSNTDDMMCLCCLARRHLVRSNTDDMMCLCCLARRHLVRADTRRQQVQDCVQVGGSCRDNTAAVPPSRARLSQHKPGECCATPLVRCAAARASHVADPITALRKGTDYAAGMHVCVSAQSS